MGEMGKGEMGTAHAGKPPSLPRELRTPLVSIGLPVVLSNQKHPFLLHRGSRNINQSQSYLVGLPVVLSNQQHSIQLHRDSEKLTNHKVIW
jgi:hypothetical protein